MTLTYDVPKKQIKQLDLALSHKNICRTQARQNKKQRTKNKSQQNEVIRAITASEEQEY